MEPFPPSLSESAAESLRAYCLKRSGKNESPLKVFEDRAGLNNVGHAGKSIDG
jgi:hypothetical protein